MFRRKQKVKQSDTELLNTESLHTYVIESLISICTCGTLYNDAFVINDYGIYVYIDIIQIQDDMAQIVFQLHHEWLAEPIMESVASAGKNREDALYQACCEFAKNVLQVYLNALRGSEASSMIEVFLQERHYFQVYQGAIYGIGKREGVMQESFWDIMGTQFIKRLGNKKAYWIKIFTSKNAEQVVCEVQINHREDGELSRSLLTYAENWDCIGDFHSEKQCLLFVQDDASFIPNDFTDNEISEYCRKAMKQFERCGSKEDVRKLRSQICSWCKDDSLGYEITGFIPELYCKYHYEEVEMGDRLFLIHNGKITRELYQSQLQSFVIIEKVIADYFLQEHPNQDALQRVLQFSSSARAIKKAIDAGDQMDELLLAGIGYVIPEDYQIR